MRIHMLAFLLFDGLTSERTSLLMNEILNFPHTMTLALMEHYTGKRFSLQSQKWTKKTHHDDLSDHLLR